MTLAAYAAALQYLKQLVLHGIQPGTERLAQVLARLGNPQAAIAAIHIAGTNGKGSTAAYCAALLVQAAAEQKRRTGAGLRVGLYISPHLHRLRERICLSTASPAGLRECSEEEFVAALDAVRTAMAEAPAVTLTFFEALTAAAFVLFHDAGIDLAVIETGLGGRLDATRLCAARVTVVTSIGLDHVELLGPTLLDIAREKAGIFRAGVPALVACDDAAVAQVLLSEAQRVQAPLRFYQAAPAQQPELLPSPAAFLLPPLPPLTRELAAAVPLAGEHQLRNAALAVAAVQQFSIDGPLQALLHDPRLLRAGLAATRWPGRLERLWPQPESADAPPPLPLAPAVQVWVDAAHNPEGAQSLDRWLARELRGRPLTVLVGVLDGKRIAEMTAPLGRAQYVVLTRAPSPRGLSAAALGAELGAVVALGDNVSEQQDWSEALRTAAQQTPAGGLLLAYGSIVLVAAVRAVFYREESDPLPVSDPGPAK